MTTAFALHKIILNHKNEPIDYIFIEANKAFEEQTELKRDNFILDLQVFIISVE
jgi:hypothetical protein